MSLKVKYWGVRGSLPSSPPPTQWVRDIESLMQEFFQAGHSRPEDIGPFLNSQSIPRVGGFGTHTTCVEVKTPRAQIIIDGGSGIRGLSDEMMKGPCGKGQGVAHIFLTHFHWDHILGLPFFVPHFLKGNEIHYYAVQPELADIVKISFRKPLFPVSFEMLGAKIHFHQLTPRKTIEIADMHITPYQLDHPDPCWGFKVEHGGRAYAHCVDTEGTRVTREALGPDLPLYQNIDLMYYDAQYTLPELASDKLNWGHSAAQIGLDIAFREKIRHVIFAHHDPGLTTQELYELKAQTREYYDWKLHVLEERDQVVAPVKWRYAYEGMEFDLSELK